MNKIPWLLFIAVFGLLGCDGKDSGNATIDADTSAGPMELELMVYGNEGMIHNYNHAVERFNSVSEDVSVVIHNVYGEDWSDFDRTFNSYIHSGRVPDIVDISVIYRDSLIHRGMLKDLMPFAEATGLDLNLYFQNQFDGLLIENALYGIPSGALLMAVYYNKDLFLEAGVFPPDLDWDTSWTRDEFADTARRIRELSTDERPVYGMSQAFSIGWIIPHLMSSGVEFLSSSDVDSGDTDPEVAETLRFLSDLMFEEELSPSILNLLNLQPYQYFMNGELGLFVDGNWWMEGFRDNADFNWGILPMPIDLEPATGLYVDFWAVPEASPNGEQAYAVLEFFLREEQQRSGIMKGIPPLRSAAEDIYADRFPGIPEEELNVWFDGISYGIRPAYFSQWNLFQNETTDILNRLGFGEIDSQEAADEIYRSYRNATMEDGI